MRSKRRRYWMFAFREDEAEGGLKDLRFTFNTLKEFEDNMLSLTEKNFTDYHVLDTVRNFDFEGDIGTVTKWVCKNIGGDYYDGLS